MSIEETFEDLQQYTRIAGHQKCFCLSPDHSLVSKVFQTDYSSWIRQKIINRNYSAIADFVWIVFRVMPRMLPENLIPYEEAIARKNVHYLLNIDFQEFINIPNKEAEIDLRVGLILGMFRESYDGFTMISETPKYITMIMLAHSIKYINAEKLLSSANEFLDRSISLDKVIFKNDLTRSFWQKYELPDSDQLKELSNIDYQSAKNIQSVLKSLPIMSRVHLFDLAGIRKDENNKVLKRVSSSNVYHQIKYWGINVSESIDRLYKANVISRETDYEKILNGISKLELEKQLNSHDIPYKKSWNKKRIESFILTLDLKVQKKILNDYEIIYFSASFIDEFVTISNIYKKILPFHKLWLSFGIKLSRLEGYLGKI